jgi:hypothetical protein
LNSILANEAIDGSSSLSHATPNSSTVLALWALNAHRDRDKLADVITRALSYKVKAQLPSGLWNRDFSSFDTWWDPPALMAALNVKNFIDSRKLLKANLSRDTSTVAQSAGPTVPIASMRGFLTRSPRVGNLVASLINGEVVEFTESGTLVQKWNTVGADARGLIADIDGTSVLLGATNGLWRLRNGDPIPIRITAQPVSVFARDPNGSLWASNFEGHEIFRVDDRNGYPMTLWASRATGDPMWQPLGMDFDELGKRSSALPPVHLPMPLSARVRVGCLVVTLER